MRLLELGWDVFFEQQWTDATNGNVVAGRVARQSGQFYQVYWEKGEVIAEITGKMRHKATLASDLPAVGDWIVMDVREQEGRGTIREVLKRKSLFSRKIAGNTTDQQVVAANVDTVFLMSGLDGDFNVRRIERYVAAAWNSGAQPVVVLNKADMCEDLPEKVRETEQVAMGVPIHVISAADRRGIEELAKYLPTGKTVAMLGSSGVGKSTLVNALVGKELQKVHAVWEGDASGRHTTTARELIVLEQGGVVIDTPGMRAIQMWDDTESGLRETFEDVQELVARCRFSDCQHKTEPGCAVKKALEQGELDAGRWANYQRMQRELRHLERQQNVRLRDEEKARWKRLHKALKERNKRRWSGQ